MLDEREDTNVHLRSCMVGLIIRLIIPSISVKQWPQKTILMTLPKWFIFSTAVSAPAVLIQRVRDGQKLHIALKIQRAL